MGKFEQQCKQRGITSYTGVREKLLASLNLINENVTKPENDALEGRKALKILSLDPLLNRYIGNIEKTNVGRWQILNNAINELDGLRQRLNQPSNQDCDKVAFMNELNEIITTTSNVLSIS